MNESSHPEAPASTTETIPRSRPKPTKRDYAIIFGFAIAGDVLGYLLVYILKTYFGPEIRTVFGSDEGFHPLYSILPHAIGWLGMSVGVVVLARQTIATGPAMLHGLAWLGLPIFALGGGWLAAYIWNPDVNSWLSSIPILIGTFAGTAVGFFFIIQTLKQFPSPVPETEPVSSAASDPGQAPEDALEEGNPPA